MSAVSRWRNRRGGVPVCPGQARSLPLLVLLLLTSTGLAGGPSFVTPWDDGDTWQVTTHARLFAVRSRDGGEEVTREARETTLTFLVRGVESIDGTACYAIEVTNDADPSVWTFHVRCRSFTLKQLVRKRGETEVRFSNPDRAYIHLREENLIPFDFPLFPDEEKDGETTFPVAGSSAEGRQKIDISEDGEQMTIILETTFNGKPLVSTQVWHRGLPWWSEARRTVGGELWETGEIKVPD